MLKTLRAWPGDSYYDPQRPKWLPFWFDSFTETAVKYGWITGYTPEHLIVPPAPKPGPAPAAPQTAQQMTTWTPADAARAQAGAFEEWKKTAFPDPWIQGRDETLVYVAAAVGALSLILLWRERR